MAVITRKVTKLEDFADTLTSIGGGWRTTFVYLNCASFLKTGQKVDMNKLSSTIDDTTSPEVSDKFNNFISKGNKRNNPFPFSGVVKVAKYTLNWQTARKHKESYEKFVKNADDIAAKYAAQALKRQGLPLTQDALDSVQIKSRKQRDYEKQEQTGQMVKPRKDARRFVDHGEGGMYIRTNDFNKKGENRVVIPQNLKNLTFGSKHYYLINDEGNIAGGGPVSEATIMNILNKKGGYDKSKANALRKLGANEEEIKAYLEEFEKLGWKEYDFLADCFLYAVASCTSDYHSGMPEKVVFFNEELIDEITTSEHNFKINPSEFMEIARNEISSTYGVTVEGKRYLKKNIDGLIRESYYNHQQNHKLFEQYIRKVVKKALKESRNGHRSGYVSNNGNSMVGGRWESWETNGSGNILEKFIKNLEQEVSDNEEFENFLDYCYDYEDIFDVFARFSVSYDDSVGYGSSSAPIYEIEDMDTSEMEEYVMNYPSNDEGFKQEVQNILKQTLNSLDEDDFDIDEEDNW